MKRRQIGVVAVDSGQLMICDPTYIKTEWSDVEFQDIRMYKHKNTGRIYKYETFWDASTVKASQLPTATIEVFPNYDALTSNGMTMNEMLELKDLVELDVPQKKELVGTFSYGGICESNAVSEHQIKFAKGHAGVAVAFSSGYGDGLYAVYGTFDDEGRCIKVEIDMALTPVQANVLGYKKKLGYGPKKTRPSKATKLKTKKHVSAIRKQKNAGKQ